MNPKLEACRACPEQCTPQQDSDSLVKIAEGQSLTAQQLRDRISRISQNAHRIGCPPSEISRIRLETIDKIDPSRSNKERFSLRAFGIRDSVALLPYEAQSNGTYLEKGKGTRSPRR